MKNFEKFPTNRFQLLVSDLCDEIDDLKDQVAYWKRQYDERNTEYSNHLNESLEQAKRGIGQALMFALSVKDDANGNLVIEKDDRKLLAEQFK